MSRRRVGLALPERWGFTLLAIFLILWGLSTLGLSFPGLSIILALLAIIAGILILVGY